ncbi:hypothetical protein [Xylanimonas allomyrinae]|uniref:hypothetical protein n=1 Tax=Xylanimonas allomyrinae TaxID=2509459 RepID=UPI0013A67B5B|nr:hypothetical protein [Xylanimonas allomyrinae]
MSLFADDGRHDYHACLACLACAMDALTHSRGRVILRTQVTGAVVVRGIPGPGRAA